MAIAAPGVSNVAISRPSTCAPRRYGAQGWPIKALPIDLDLKVPIAMISPKPRSLSPVVKVFIEHARQVAQDMAREA